MGSTRGFANPRIEPNRGFANPRVGLGIFIHKSPKGFPFTNPLKLAISGPEKNMYRKLGFFGGNISSDPPKPRGEFEITEDNPPGPRAAAEAEG